MTTDTTFEAFEEVIVDHFDLRLEWEYIGEGVSGDYNPDDPDDIPLLRFTISRVATPLSGEYEPVEDASYCTMVRITTPRQVLWGAGKAILQAFSNNEDSKLLEQLSWITLEIPKGI